MGDYDSSPSHWYDDQLSFMSTDLDSNSPRRILSNHHHYNRHQQPLPYGLNASSAIALNNIPNLQCKKELELQFNNHMLQRQQNHHLHEPLHLQLPQLESPDSNYNSLPYGTSNDGNNLQPSSNIPHDEQLHNGDQSFSPLYEKGMEEMCRDWRVFDKFVASQLSNEEAAAAVFAHQKINDEGMELVENDEERVVDMGEEYSHAHAYAASTSSSCQIDLWK